MGKEKMYSKTIFHIIAIISIILFSMSLAPKKLQNDTFYTVKIGEQIVNNGIDMKDHFSWHEGLPYTYPHWLYDTIMYEIYDTWNWDGIYISTVILSAILGLAIYLTNTKLTKNNITSFILTIGVMYLMKDYIAARAQLPTFILFVLTIYCIEMLLKTKKKRYVVSLVIIPILIANLHVAVWPFYFVLYLPYIVEFLLVRLVDLNIIQNLKIGILKILEKIIIVEEKKKEIKEKIEKTKENKEDIKKNRIEKRNNPYKIIVKKNNVVVLLILIMCICVLTGLLTPLKEVPYTYLVKTMQGNTTQYINEHLPLTLFNQKDILFVIAAIIAIVMLTDIKIELHDLFLIAGLTVLMLMSKRQISLFLILGILVVNRLICAFIEKYNCQKDIEKITELSASFFGRIVILLAIVLISGKNYKEIENDKYISESEYPVKACEWIIENIDLGKAKFYNEYNYGSYMLYKGIPVFIDSRADLYAPEFNGGQDIFSDFLNTSNIGVYYEDKFNEYNITHIIQYKSAKLVMFMSINDNYKSIYEDNNFIIYEKIK